MVTMMLHRVLNQPLVLKLQRSTSAGCIILKAGFFNDLPGSKMLLLHTIISTRALSHWMNWKPPSGTARGNLRLTRYHTSCLRDAFSSSSTLRPVQHMLECSAVPSIWKKGVIRLIPKALAASDTHHPNNLRPIALSSCVGKLFTTMLKNRWINFMVKKQLP